MKKHVLLFMLLNFSALLLGGFFTSEGVVSDWYQNMNQAPWTPPGWVFGFAWTTVMICLSFFMARAIQKSNSRRFLILLFSLQWILNVLWNPVFFYFRETGLGLLVITTLLLIVTLLFTITRKDIKLASLLILPYILWLTIATSLNTYIFINN